MFPKMMTPYQPTAANLTRDVRLRQRVPAINNNIRPSRETRGVARKVQIQTLDLLNMSLATQRRHSKSFGLDFRRSAHFGVEESGRDDVDLYNNISMFLFEMIREEDLYPREISPFTCDGLAKMSDEGFAAVVDGLVDGHVDYVAGDGRGDDEVAGTLALEDFSRVFCAVDDSID
jgi:hypothetical protein